MYENTSSASRVAHFSDQQWVVSIGIVYAKRLSSDAGAKIESSAPMCEHRFLDRGTPGCIVGSTWLYRPVIERSSPAPRCRNSFAGDNGVTRRTESNFRAKQLGSADVTTPSG